MNWWYRLSHRKQMDEQLDKELRFHLERHAADLIARGHPPAEARRQARMALGGAEQVKEECWDARGTRWLEDLAQDFRYALRILRQKPGFAMVALLTLALGVGATTLMFTVVNGVLLKPLPYPHPDRLLRLQEKTAKPTQFGDLWAFTYPNFLDSRSASHALELAAWRYGGGTLSEPGEADYADSREISAELFAVLGAAPVLGRAFLPEEDRPGAAPVAIISQGLWQRRFGGSQGAIGRRVVLDGKSYTVVGVMPPAFRLGDDDVDLFTLLGQDTQPFMQNRAAHFGLQVWARLRPGATLEAARAELAVIGHQLAEQYPKSNAGRTFVADPLRPEVGEARSTLWLLFGAVGLVLLIACVNVASLLLARAVSRDSELAMRAALGAGRSRLMRQCLTESAVLGLAGGGLGIAFAAVGLRPFVAFWPGNLPRAQEVQLDWHVLLFAIAVSLACGILFGIAPALRAPARELERTLRAGVRTVAGRSRRLHGGFVATEIALAVVLLVSAGMLGRTLLRLSSLDPGLNIQNVLIARLALSPGAFANPEKTRGAWQDVLESARRAPGVESIAMVDTVPMREGINELGYWNSPAMPPRNEMPLALATSVTPDYLKVMGIPLRLGRFFDDQDRIGNQPVVVIDEVLAQRAFGGEKALGKRLWIPDMGDAPVEVVGVVGHVRHWGLANDDQAQVRAQFYYPFSQVPDSLLRRWSELMSIAVRTSSAPLNVVESLRREVRGASNDQVLSEVRTMDQLARGTLAQQRFLLLLFGIFAGLALLLSCIGIYGVLAYLTSQRVPEFGVRLALGASAGEVMWLVLRQSLGMIFTGVMIGTLVALGAANLLERSVSGMQHNEPMTFALMIVLLVGAALFASFLPARRASRIDPMSALRQE
ncbi:MAG: ADOP family duplicated permease [Bryobacteraceae bacterium]